MQREGGVDAQRVGGQRSVCRRERAGLIRRHEAALMELRGLHVEIAGLEPAELLEVREAREQRS
jgi:hypothetical protein